MKLFQCSFLTQNENWGSFFICHFVFYLIKRSLVHDVKLLLFISGMHVENTIFVQFNFWKSAFNMVLSRTDTLCDEYMITRNLKNQWIFMEKWNKRSVSRIINMIKMTGSAEPKSTPEYTYKGEHLNVSVTGEQTENAHFTVSNY